MQINQVPCSGIQGGVTSGWQNLDIQGKVQRLVSHELRSNHFLLGGILSPANNDHR